MQITRVGMFLSVAFTLAAVSNIRAETFNVGGAINWTINPNFNYTVWAKNTSAMVGDSLLFTYNAESHDVKKVTAEQYATCDEKNYLELWNSGADTILLNSSGTWYFLCSKPQHCSLGQKLSIDVASSRSKAASSPSPSPSSTASLLPSLLWMITLAAIVVSFIVNVQVYPTVFRRLVVNVHVSTYV
ncbi:hypothetical protein R1sor_006728 [Riccia sorocarpa]|uniref:Phytocyanin domain-containing protein n=1 Tax=Riccia sorocarpa TaxID=122646 RepID=A0ABD3HND6_9MARC